MVVVVVVVVVCLFSFGRERGLGGGGGGSREEKREFKEREENKQKKKVEVEEGRGKALRSRETEKALPAPSIDGLCSLPLPLTTLTHSKPPVTTRKNATTPASISTGVSSTDASCKPPPVIARGENRRRGEGELRGSLFRPLLIGEAKE